MLSSTPCVSRIRWTELFVERGYVGTSLLTVAEAAGVAPRTVYVRFRSKAQLLSQYIDVSIVGTGGPVALTSG